MHDNKKRNDTIFIIITVIVVALFFIGLSVVKDIRASSIYNQAVALYDAHSYEEAKTLFESIKDTNKKDTVSYIHLCQARIYYQKELVSAAYYELEGYFFHHMTDAQRASMNSFKNTLYSKHNADMEKKLEADRKAYRDKIENGVPFVGMPESEIKNTSLGAPSDEVRHNNEMKNGKIYVANLYDFVKGGRTIFTARCINGKVTEVWDQRNLPNNTDTPKKKTNKNKSDDPYNAKNYSNEEDFYDDFYDDFSDYYEALDYYNEHH